MESVIEEDEAGDVVMELGQSIMTTKALDKSAMSQKPPPAKKGVVKAQSVKEEGGPLFKLNMQKGKPKPQLDRRQSNMQQLESAIMQRFQDINKNKNVESDEDNEESSSEPDSG